jgi:hypothetical protein
MRRTFQLGAAALVCFGSVAVYTQGPPARSAFPASDTAYKSSLVPELPAPGPDMRVGDNATARREWMRERMGGALSPQFMESMMAAEAAQRAKNPGAFTAGGPGS